MSFKAFIYYCAMCGGWGAFLAWALLDPLLGMNPHLVREELFRKGEVFSKFHAMHVSSGIAGCLGLVVATAVGLMDALANAKPSHRPARVGMCAVLGFLGGMLGGYIGAGLLAAVGLQVMKLVGWLLVGAMVGASIGVFDLIGGLGTGDLRGPIKKALNGLYGGLLGGFLGGIPFTLFTASEQLQEAVPRGGLAACLVILGLCIGLLIGLAQVILKQAWVRVEEGFRPGRELLLTKEEITIGRAEGCDLLLLADNSIAKLHATIKLKNGRYLLSHAAEDGETLVNDEPVNKPTPLRAGDLIRIGRSVIKFGEKEKRR